MLRARASYLRVSTALVSLLIFLSLPIPSVSATEDFQRPGAEVSSIDVNVSVEDKKTGKRQFGFPYVPDSRMTTGSLCNESDPDYETDRYSESIPYCRRNVSKSTKNSIYISYGVKTDCRSTYTIDHFIPLALGGTNRVDNLWPESKAIKALRPQLEQELFQKMEKGRITQADAVRIIIEAKLNPDIQDPSALEICY